MCIYLLCFLVDMQLQWGNKVYILHHKFDYIFFIIAEMSMFFMLNRGIVIPFPRSVFVWMQTVFCGYLFTFTCVHTVYDINAKGLCIYVINWRELCFSYKQVRSFTCVFVLLSLSYRYIVCWWLYPNDFSFVASPCAPKLVFVNNFSHTSWYM